MKIIRQYEIEPALHKPTIIEVPRFSKLLKIHSSNGEHIFAWFLENTLQHQTEKYHFYTIPTDWEIEKEHPISKYNSNVKYFNTVFIRDGEIVFHVFCSDPIVDIHDIL